MDLWVSCLSVEPPRRSADSDVHNNPRATVAVDDP